MIGVKHAVNCRRSSSLKGEIWVLTHGRLAFTSDAICLPKTFPLSQGVTDPTGDLLIHFPLWVFPEVPRGPRIHLANRMISSPVDKDANESFRANLKRLPETGDIKPPRVRVF